jgi:hypothetical protein
MQGRYVDPAFFGKLVPISIYGMLHFHFIHDQLTRGSVIHFVYSVLAFRSLYPQHQVPFR